MHRLKLITVLFIISKNTQRREIYIELFLPSLCDIYNLLSSNQMTENERMVWKIKKKPIELLKIKMLRFTYLGQEKIVNKTWAILKISHPSFIKDDIRHRT